MTHVPTFSVSPLFLGLKRQDSEAELCIAGIPFDLGTTNRSGARFGPHAIRHASRMLVDGAHPRTFVRPDTLAISDVGNFSIALGDIAASMAAIEQQAAAIRHVLALGGDHSVSLPLMRALARRFGPLALVHFDAHVDTWPTTFGQTLGHGSVFYRGIEEELIDPHRMIQIGIRSPVERDVLEWTLGHGVSVLSAEDVHEAGPAAVAGRIREVTGEAPAYLSFDVDALDPAFAPGTGTPEVGGLASWQAQSILRRLSGTRFVGMDIVEVAPAYDVAEITALAAATVAWEYLSLVAGQAEPLP